MVTRLSLSQTPVMKKIKFALTAVLLGFMAIGVMACSKDDDSDDSGSGGNGSGSVKITSVVRGSKTAAHYTYKVTVKASGVSASDVTHIGVSYGKTSSASGSTSGTRGTTSTTRSITLYSKSTYYLQPFLSTAKGKVYGTKKRVKVP